MEMQLIYGLSVGNINDSSLDPDFLPAIFRRRGEKNY
jgi:hypothetical protein